MPHFPPTHVGAGILNLASFDQIGLRPQGEKCLHLSFFLSCSSYELLAAIINAIRSSSNLLASERTSIHASSPPPSAPRTASAISPTHSLLFPAAQSDLRALCLSLSPLLSSSADPHLQPASHGWNSDSASLEHLFASGLGANYDDFGVI